MAGPRALVWVPADPGLPSQTEGEDTSFGLRGLWAPAQGPGTSAVTVTVFLPEPLRTPGGGRGAAWEALPLALPTASPLSAPTPLSVLQQRQQRPLLHREGGQ